MSNSLRTSIWFVATVVLLWFTSSEADPPTGWILAGSEPQEYEVGTVVTGNSGAVAYLRSQVENAAGFGTLMQTYSAAPHRGKRLRMTGAVKALNVQSWAGLWMRIDGSDKKKPLGFDNMQNRPIVGTTEWQRYEIVLDIPHESKDIAFGILLVGNGEVMLDDIRFDEVDENVDATRLPVQLPITPSNLDFEN